MLNKAVSSGFLKQFIGNRKGVSIDTNQYFNERLSAIGSSLEGPVYTADVKHVTGARCKVLDKKKISFFTEKIVSGSQRKSYFASEVLNYKIVWQRECPLADTGLEPDWVTFGTVKNALLGLSRDAQSDPYFSSQKGQEAGLWNQFHDLTDDLMFGLTTRWRPCDRYE